MTRDYEISLNFLPILSDSFPFTIYRRKDAGETKDSFPEEVRRYSLPEANSNSTERFKYWVSYVKVDGFERFENRSDFNHHITREYLHRLLLESCRESKLQIPFSDDSRFANKRISFTLKKHKEGRELIWIQAYFLKSVKKFGFLIDFRFKKNEETPFSRRVQQLSLSLDKRGRENRNFYSDRYDKIHHFISSKHNLIFPLKSEHGSLQVSDTLIRLQGRALERKQYVFKNNQINSSQFMGVKKYGPLEKLPDSPDLFFVYREQDRLLSLDLYKALRGDTYPNVFSGTDKMFGFSLSPENVKGIAVKNFTEQEIKRVRDTVIARRKSQSHLVVLIAPWDKEDVEDSEEYFYAKHTLISAGIASQVVRTQTLEHGSNLKWSTSNIALQCFSKLGGKPWKVEPKHSNCLIIGVVKSHREITIEDESSIQKYYAYSVLTDSSGLFKELRILGHSDNSAEYLQQLKQSIQSIINDHKSSYNRFVIHAPYKIRLSELHSIEEVFEDFESDDHQFVVLRINSRNDFFGYSSSNNSLVPFESTHIATAWDEYLVWFEGLQYHNPKVSKRYARPVQIVFHYTNKPLSDDHMLDYLQDAVNLSGANWRGFNAKNLPVSIYYAQLIARFTNHFNSLDLDEIDLNNLNPWFL